MNQTFRIASSALASTWLVFLFATLHEACSDDTVPSHATDSGKSSGDGAAKESGGAKDSGSDAPIDVDGGPPVLVALGVTTAEGGSTPLALVPKFAPGVHDYYVRCAAGTNTFAVSMAASTGAESMLLQPEKSHSAPKQTVSPLNVKENQAIVAAATRGGATVEYWVRCLPHDFPSIQMEPHPEAGTPLPGYYLVGNFLAIDAMGGYAMVLNADGVPLWYHPQASAGVSDVDEIVDGAISFASVRGGPFEVYELSPYGETNVAPTGVVLDLHELRVLSNGDYLVLSNPSHAGVDLTGLSLETGDGGALPLGPGSTINACNIVEFDPETGAVVWTWSATDHFDPVKDTTEPILAPPLSDGGTVIDTFHCNSIDVDPANGNLLVSARQMDSVFYIERSTGTVLWKMGGAEASIDNATYVPVTSPFYGQHDARLQPGWSACGGGRISLFDDQTYGKQPARGVLYDVAIGSGDGGCDAGTAGASVAWQYAGKASSGASGSFRISADGSRVIGWGLQSESIVFTEVDDGGNDLIDLVSTNSAFVSPMQSYRAIKVPEAALDLDAMRMTAGLAAP
jgi:arylsulfotransferase ASST